MQFTDQLDCFARAGRRRAVPASIFVLFPSLFPFHRPLSSLCFSRRVRSLRSTSSGFPRARATRAGKAISRKWRARYTGVRRNFEFLTGIRAAESPALWSDESAVCRCANVPRMFRAFPSLRGPVDSAISGAPHYPKFIFTAS